MNAEMSAPGKLRFLLAIALALAAGPALAWGKAGHQITGIIAGELLTAEARVRINALSPGFDIAEESSWLDEEKPALKHRIPGSDKWHYINLPVCGQKTAEQICPRGNCATRQIDEYQKILADTKASRDDRLFALRALIHLVGDVHQPLHAADNNDRGGNAIPVGPGKSNLHAVWDTGLVQMLIHRRTVQAVADDLLAWHRKEIPRWQSRRPSYWAAESNLLAKQVAYGALPGFSCQTPPTEIDALPPAYIDEALQVVEIQLAKAGARIAYVLNAAFSLH